MMKLFI